MKAKKLLLLLIISISCFVPVVNAKEDVTISEIEPFEISEGIEVNSYSKVDLEFNDLNQSTKYEVTLKNNTDRDLYVNSLQIDGSSQNFMKYTLDEESRSKVIKANSKGKINIIVSTKNEKGAGKNLSDNISFKILLNDKIVNPNTNSNLISIIILIIIGAVAITFVMTKFNNKKGTIATVIVCFMLLGTSFVFADDTVVVNFKGKVKYSSQNLVSKSPTTVISGKVTYLVDYFSQVKNINIASEITEIKDPVFVQDLTVDGKKRVMAYVVANGDQSVPYDIYVMSNGVIYAPEDATGLFSFPNVETINGLENVMFDNTVKMTGMFIGNEKLNKVDLSTVDTTNVKDTSYMFHKCLSLNVDKSKFNLENTEIKNNMFVQYLEDEIIKDAKSDKDIDFSQISSSTNGEGLYFISGTEKDKNPIYYYRGNVDNNNLVFANKCWKIVRTTATGGTKLIYNGVPQDTYNITIGSDEYINISNDKTYPFTYDSSTNQWVSTNKSHSKSSEISFNITDEGNYILKYTVSSEKKYDKAYFYKDGTQLAIYDGTDSGEISLGYVTKENVIRVKYTKDGSVNTGSDNIKFSVARVSNTPMKICDNTGTASQIGTSQFNSNVLSPAYGGYMYGSVYNRLEKSATAITAGMVYGNDIEYKNGKYTLKDTYISPNGWATDYSKIGEKYHYTCFSTESSCEKVNYIFFDGNANTAYYFELTDGKTQLDILDEMLKNSSNENNSIIKTYIDDWYSKNMVNYTNYLEDTVWCNDRSISELNGWDKDKNATDYLYFGPRGRLIDDFKPSLECKNPNDRFTVNSSNGNGKLTYPVALLTADEIALAGARWSTYNSNFYLFTGQNWWVLSPYIFNYNYASEFILYSAGYLWSGYVSHSLGVRPSVSLKSGIDYTSGTGTTTNPYVID